MRRVAATPGEVREPRPGDDLVAPADVVMDRAFTVPGTPPSVFPWILQLGKHRGGWYLPRRVERFVPVRRRALRHLEPRWQRLQPGDVVPDYGGAGETFTVASIDAPYSLVYRSQRRSVVLSWSILLRAVDTEGGARTRVLLRLRLGPVRRLWLAKTAGEALDAITIAGMAAGLTERLSDSSARAR